MLWLTANGSIYHLPFKGSTFRWYAPGGVSAYDFIDCIGSASLCVNTIWCSGIPQNSREQSESPPHSKHWAELGVGDQQSLKGSDPNVQLALFRPHGDDLFPKFSELDKWICRAKVRIKCYLFAFSFETGSHHRAQAELEVLRIPNANRQTTTPGRKSPSFYSAFSS